MPETRSTANPLPSSTRNALESRLRGEVHVDEVTRSVFATDASPFRVQPLAVCCPVDAEDLRTTVEIASEHGVAVLPRGAGTSLAGQTVGQAIVVDMTRHMDQILSVDPAQQSASVQPGLVLDDLNEVLKEHNLMFPPDPATHNRCTIGGMIGNNSAGSHSIQYGQTVDHVLELDAVHPDGKKIHFEPVPRDKTDERSTFSSDHEWSLVSKILNLCENRRDVIRERYPNILRNVAGYALDRLVDCDPVNPADLLVGSEGTLAAVSRARLNLVPVPEHTVLGVVQFDDLWDALDSVQHIVKTDPSAVELIDQFLMNLARNNDIFGKYAYFIEGNPDGLLMVEYTGNSMRTLRGKLKDLEELAMGSCGANTVSRMIEPEEQKAAWKVREGGLHIVMSHEGDGKPTPFVEDSAVPVENLRAFGRAFYEVLDEFNLDAAYYGHASVGLLHIRPVLNLHEEADRKKMSVVARRIALLARKHGGTYSGEHGEGLIRSWLNKEYYGPELTDTFQAIKNLFDPDHLMNPGKIVDPDITSDRFRYSEPYGEKQIDSYLDHSQQGNLVESVEACNGNGLCRKTDSGTMCPSYMATGSEIDTTRARANALREAIAGDLDPDMLTSDEMSRVMDLCIGCKACKSECPAGVDMARLKFEFLCHYNEENGTSLRDRLLGKAGRLLRTAASVPGGRSITRFLSGGSLESLFKHIFGLHGNRELPTPSTRSVVERIHGRRNENGPSAYDVRLFVDSFTGYIHPETAVAAVDLLEDLGYRVKVEEQPCCGRPAFSKGLFSEWSSSIRNCYEALEPDLEANRPIIVIEPSCYSSLASDAEHLLPDEKSKKLANGVITLESFLANSDRFQKRCSSVTPSDENTIIHPHCHQEAIPGTKNLQTILHKIPGLSVNLLEAGCCGMAGSFGYEREHYDVSVKMAERRLIPAVERAETDTSILTTGFSCRHQISDLTERTASHPVELLRSILCDK